MLVAQSGKSATLRRLRSRVQIASSTPILLMKHLKRLIIIPLLTFSLTGCDLLSDFIDTDEIHNNSFEAATGKFVLYENADSRFTYNDTYFVIDGSKANFSLKYYENGVLKVDGKIQKVVTHDDYIGHWCNNLHFNVKVGDRAEHISCYTESLDPLDQFRIIEEYYMPGEAKYYLSELPFVLGTYVREGKEFIEEKPHKNQKDYITPTFDYFTNALNGMYRLDDDHYFYFLCPRGWSTPDGSFLDAYFQYFSSELDKPIEGFVSGYSYEYSNTERKQTFTMKTRRNLIDWGDGTEGRISFGYNTFDENDRMIDHYGTINFSNGVMNSFSFEHLSEPWTEKEWDEFIKNENYKLRDNILYEFVGGTYTRV